MTTVETSAEALNALAREFALASLLTAYPDQEFEETRLELFPSLREHAGVGDLVRWLDTQPDINALRAAYIDLFDRGKGRASLYETEYGRMRGMSKGNDLADLSGFYNAFGLTLADDAHEMLDHIAIELEFYAMLLAKQSALAEAQDTEGSEIVFDARKTFLKDHLGSFGPAIGRRQEVHEDAAYGSVFDWCSALIVQECTQLGITPTPLDYFTDDDAGREMRCASLPIIQ